MVALDPALSLSRTRALLVAGLLFLVEILGIGTLFKHGIDFTCLDNWPAAACEAASGTLVALYCICGAALLFGILRPTALSDLTEEAGARIWPLAINLLGVCLALVPLSFMQEGSGSASLLPAFAFWMLGMGLLLCGLALFIAPLTRWRNFITSHTTTLAPMFIVAASAPWLAGQIRPLWQLETIAGATFSAVAAIIEGVGYDVEIYPEEKVIGGNNFFIDVAPQCSGVEGLALVTIFVSLYLWLFRSDLRFPRAFWLFPIGLAASATFNVLRIAILLAIGLEGNPELAVGGFHSHAGWLMFTLIALGIVVAAQSVPALRRAPEPVQAAQSAAQPLPFFSDPVVAHILPFAVFMLSALLAQAFSQSPGVVYPLRVLAMGAAVLAFWSVLRALPWRPSPVAIAAGVAVAVMWIAVPVPPADGAPPFGNLTGAALLGWYIARGLGTILLVPIIEELFFRGYLERKLRLGTGAVWPVLSALIIAGLFAALHDRWVEAFAASLVFSLAMAQRGRVSDAIWAHAVANALIFFAAVATGNLAMI